MVTRKNRKHINQINHQCKRNVIMDLNTLNYTLFTRHALIVGSSGSGKTHLASMILQKINCLKIIFDSEGDLTDKLQNDPNVTIVNLDDTGRGETLSFTKKITQNEILDECVTDIVENLIGTKQTKSYYQSILLNTLKIMLKKGISSATLLDIGTFLQTEDILESFIQIYQGTLDFNKVHDLSGCLIRAALASNTQYVIDVDSLPSKVNLDVKIEGIRLNNETLIINAEKLGGSRHDEERTELMSKILRCIYEVSRRSGITDQEELKILFFVDEFETYCPKGNRKTECKDMILEVLKRGRKFGLGLLAVVQNYSDIYGNAASMFYALFVGNIRSKPSLATLKNVFDSNMLSILPKLTCGKFAVFIDGSVSILNTYET